VLAAAGAEAPEKAEEEVPLWDFLGDLSYPITTRDELAQRYFDQGLRLSYAFNHAEAIRAFRQAQRLDPTCAMCYWGEAYALGPNINAPMDEAAVEPAFAAISKAQALAGSATEREQALISATARRYSPDPRADRAALDAAYADAMAEAAAEFPDDHEIAALYAEAVMDLSPWDYWEDDAATPKGQIGQAIEAIEGVLAEDRDHPFAIHLYIHLVEASTTPERAEPYADRLGAAMRGAGHMVHMPAHIYFRLGRYLDSLASNYAAVAADEYFFERVGDAAGWLERHGFPVGDRARQLSWTPAEGRSGEPDEEALFWLTTELVRLELEEGVDIRFGYSAIQGRAGAILAGGVERSRLFTLGSEVDLEGTSSLPDDDLEAHLDVVRALLDDRC
jgi:tetratricopeptide (TPR) repeat protein